MIYLDVQVEEATIQKEVNAALTALYGPIVKRLGQVPEAKKSAEYARELDQYKSDIAPIFKAAAERHTAAVDPLARIIDDDITAKEDAKKVKDRVYNDGVLLDWNVAGDTYLRQVEAAKKSLDLNNIDPDVVFSGH